MLQNLTNVNPQMQQLTESAVVAAREKFGISLDFTENSLKQLDTLLQQAHEGYKQTSSIENPPNIPIDNTVRVWGSYFGEVIRRIIGGNWIVDQKNVFLDIRFQRVDPLEQVRLQIVNGSTSSIQAFFWKINQDSINTKEEPSDGINYCPKCGTPTTSFFEVCKHCGYALTAKVQEKSPEQAPLPYSAISVNISRPQCPNCHGYKVSTVDHKWLLILNIILVIMTMGVWLLAIGSCNWSWMMLRFLIWFYLTYLWLFDTLSYQHFCRNQGTSEPTIGIL